MKNIISRFFLTAFFFCLFSSVSAQQPWTLQQCIDRALQYNIQIKQSSLSSELSRLQVRQNEANFLPSLNANASQNYFYGRSIDPYTNAFTTQQVKSNSFSLSSSIPVFEGFSLQNTLKESKLTYLSSQNDLKKIQNDISINVVNYYLLLLYNDELVKVTKAQVDASVVQRDRMKRMFDLGSVSKGNYLDLESQLASDQVRMIDAQSQFDQSLLSLTQLLELDTIKNFSVVRPEVTVPPFDSISRAVDEIYFIALTNQPDIKSSEFKVKASEKALSVAKGADYPRIYLNGSLSTNYSNSSQNVNYVSLPPTETVTGFTSGGDTVYSYFPSQSAVFTDKPFKDQLNDNLGKSFGFSLQVPIFNGLNSRTNIDRSKIALEQSRLNSDLTKKNLYKSVQQATIDAVSSYNKFTASQRSVDAITETYNYNEQRLNLGLISTFDYSVSKNNLANAQATLLQAKYDYIFRVKILDFYQGKPLAF